MEAIEVAEESGGQVFLTNSIERQEFVETQSTKKYRGYLQQTYTETRIIG